MSLSAHAGLKDSSLLNLLGAFLAGLHDWSRLNVLRNTATRLGFNLSVET